MLVVVFVADIYRLYAGTSWTGLHVESEISSNSQEGRRRLYICREWVCSVVFRCFQVLGIIDRAWLARAGVRAAAGSWGTRAWWSLSPFVALVGFPLQTENHKTSSSKPLEVLGVSFLCFSHPKRNCLYRRSCKLANGRDTTRLRILHGKVYARKVLHRQCKQKRVKQPCHTGGPRYFGELHHAGLVWALRLGTIKANSRQVTINHPSLIFPCKKAFAKEARLLPISAACAENVYKWLWMFTGRAPLACNPVSTWVAWRMLDLWKFLPSFATPPFLPSFALLHARGLVSKLLMPARLAGIQHTSAPFRTNWSDSCANGALNKGSVMVEGCRFCGLDANLQQMACRSQHIATASDQAPRTHPVSGNSEPRKPHNVAKEGPQMNSSLCSHQKILYWAATVLFARGCNMQNAGTQCVHLEKVGVLRKWAPQPPELFNVQLKLINVTQPHRSHSI